MAIQCIRASVTKIWNTSCSSFRDADIKALKYRAENSLY